MTSPLEEIKNRIDLVNYLRPYVANLAPSGKSLKGLCPFHKEKTPSFFISPDKQVWYCFGCQKGGDLMKFVMEIERMEFSEALRFLADKAGVVLERQDPKLLTLKNKVIEVLKQTDRFYRFQLTKNKQAQDYLSDRGLKPETINFFGVGFAPQGWQNLFNYLKKLGFGDNEIEQAGMIIKRAYSASSKEANSKAQSYYDRFRSRIMFPIFDVTNRVIGFSGRVLPFDSVYLDKTQDKQGKPQQEQVEEALTSPEATAGQAKYINTPETIVYQKGKVLYGFSQTQNEIRAKEQAILVEGNLDVLMGWQEGLKNIVAVSGTGLTEFQLRNLSRFCKSLVLSFDMDKAGEQATDRSIGLASQMGFDISVLSLPTGQAGLPAGQSPLGGAPEGKDMADFAQMFSDKVAGLLEQTKNVMQYYFDKVFSVEARDSVDQKKKALAYLLPRIKFLRNPVEQNDWLTKLSSRIKVPEKMIFEEFAKTKSLLEVNQDADENQATVGSAIFIKSRQERLAEKILGLAVRFPELAPDLKEFSGFFPYRLKELALFLSQPERQTEETSQTMEPDTLNYLYLLGDYETSLLPEKFSPQREFEKSLLELKKVSMKSKIADIAMAMKEADQMGNKERSEMLVKEINATLLELGEFENDEQNL